MDTKRKIDDHKLIYHPKRVSQWLEKGDCYPVYVEIEPTNRCNHNCIFCGLDWARGRIDIDTKIMLDTLGQMGKLGVKSVCFAGAGEPTLHKDFPLFVKHAKESGIDVSFSTNGAFFDPEKAKATLPYASWIRFSFNAGTPETYSKIHRCSEKDFDKVISNITAAVEIKRKNNYLVDLEVQIVLMPENADTVLQLGEICKKIGVDLFLVKPYSRNPNSINKHDIDYKKFQGLKEGLEKLSDKDFTVVYREARMDRIETGKDYPVCHGLPFFAIITAAGNISPCNFYFNKEEFSYGNLNENSFEEIWTGKKRKQVLDKIKNLGVNCCETGCRLDKINSYLNRLKNLSSNDNFI